MLRTYMCPYCWQWIDTIIDLSIAEQTYLEDCEVCCRPIEIHYCLTEALPEDMNQGWHHLNHDTHESFMLDESHSTEELQGVELRLTCFEVRRENGGEWG